MTVAQAEELLDTFFAPRSADDFFDAAGRESFDITGHPNALRQGLLGDDPRRTLLAGYASHAERLTSHGLNPPLPPPTTRPATSADDFRALIQSFHDRDYTVVFPDVAPLSAPLQQAVRALETSLGVPVTPTVFWSKAEARAIVHYDNRDNIAVQVYGRKRWFVSTAEPGLQNDWKQVGEPIPQLGEHRVIDVGPGDLIYIPRGTPHTVESTSESVHLAILFAPLTISNIVSATLDLLSDRDPSLRQRAGGRPDRIGGDALRKSVAAALDRLSSECGNTDFIEEALALRSARMVAGLDRLPRPSQVPALSPATMMRHTPLAITNLRHANGVIDFAVPGEQLAIHAGVEPELRFIAETQEFMIRDIPGHASAEVKLALIAKLVAVGLLAPVE